MPKATGSIHYIEHRSPMKDETGEYLIHPQFVYSDIYDFKDMTKGNAASSPDDASPICGSHRIH